MHEREVARFISLGLSGGSSDILEHWCYEVEVSGCSSSDLVLANGSFSQRLVIEGNCDVDPVRVLCIEVEGESPSSCLAFAISL